MKAINLIFKHCKPNDLWRKRIIWYITSFLIFLGFYLVLILLYIYPHWPMNVVGWFILIVIGIPISLYLEWTGEFVFNKKVGLKISHKNFSVKRIMLALFVFIVIGGILVFLWFIFKSFLSQYFK